MGNSEHGVKLKLRQAYLLTLSELQPFMWPSLTSFSNWNYSPLATPSWKLLRFLNLKSLRPTIGFSADQASFFPSGLVVGLPPCAVHEQVILNDVLVNPIMSGSRWSCINLCLYCLRHISWYKMAGGKWSSGEGSPRIKVHFGRVD